MFEPVHGSAPDIAGQNKANPLTTWQSAKMMLAFLGEVDGAQMIDDAITQTTQSDISNLGTKEITEKALSFIL